jgi:hypothetical protein
MTRMFGRLVALALPLTPFAASTDSNDNDDKKPQGDSVGPALPQSRPHLEATAAVVGQRRPARH